MKLVAPLMARNERLWFFVFFFMGWMGLADAPTQSLVPLLQDSSQRFSFSLQKELDRGKNTIYSPSSLHELLSVLLMGTRGKTAFEIEKALELGGLSGHVADAYKEYRANAKTTPASYRLRSANSLWVQRGFPLLAQFSTIVGTTFSASEHTVDFSKEPRKAREVINRYVSTQTEGKIPEILDREALSKQSKLLLINTSYFSAPWQYPFPSKQTKPGKFLLMNGKKISTPFMTQVEQFQVYRGEDLDLLVLPYRSADAQMLILVPKPNQFSKLEKELSIEKLKQWRSKLEYQRVRLQLPKFKITSSHKLDSVLKELGIQQAYTTQADFSGMTLEKGLVLGEVLQKAFIRVDEAGTEAAAASTVHMYLTSTPDAATPKDFTVDRPFIYLIEDSTNALPLFIGRVTRPKSG